MRLYWIEVFTATGLLLAFMFAMPIIIVQRRLPDDGVYKVTSVTVPDKNFQNKMTLALQSAGTHETTTEDFAIGAISGFDHCCAEQKVDCGCLNAKFSFWDKKITAKTYPCPKGVFPKVPCEGK